MNILFLTMNGFTDIEMHNIYSDLMKEFIAHGHRPYIVTPREKKSGEKTELIEYDDYGLLKVQIGNTSGVSLIEKGISTITLSHRYYRAIIKHLGKMSFDLILYSTPPITLVGPVKKLKKKMSCRTYLMLKDIFPQNAVDLHMFSPRGLIHKYFRAQEKALYRVSDTIGCMSKANVEYVLRQNPEVAKEKVELCPNAIIPHEKESRVADKDKLRAEYHVPEQAVVYLYGGNLGKPQAIPYLVECLKDNLNREDRFFVICGSGSEFHLLDEFVKEYQPSNVRLNAFLPKEQYDAVVRGCDVGLLFLDADFTIPNYPSRILSYMEYGMPVVAATDIHTDVGTDAEENGYGVCCESRRVSDFSAALERLNEMGIDEAGERAREYLETHFTAERVYEIVMEENQ